MGTVGTAMQFNGAAFIQGQGSLTLRELLEQRCWLRSVPEVKAGARGRATVTAPSTVVTVQGLGSSSRSRSESPHSATEGRGQSRKGEKQHI